jgi:hypothetical protein
LCFHRKMGEVHLSQNDCSSFSPDYLKDTSITLITHRNVMLAHSKWNSSEKISQTKKYIRFGPFQHLHLSFCAFLLPSQFYLRHSCFQVLSLHAVIRACCKENFCSVTGLRKLSRHDVTFPRGMCAEEHF